MKKGIFCVLVCMLMIFGSVVPISGTIFTTEPSQLRTQRNAEYDEAEKIINELEVKLDKVTTKQEALVLVNNAIVELDNHGLLPNGMSARLVQRLTTQRFLHTQFLSPYQNINDNDLGNSNCLVIGIANMTYFRPFPTILGIPLIYRLAFENNGSNAFLLNLLFAGPYFIRTMQPIKFGPYAYVGGRLKETANGNVTLDDFRPAVGWIWTYGANGPQKWKGTFYGSLSVKYQNGSDNGTTYEWWDPIGIKGFFGINFFNFISFSGGNKLASIYIGFARKVNMTYSFPLP
jgi:hypothetical protein